MRAVIGDRQRLGVCDDPTLRSPPTIGGQLAAKKAKRIVVVRSGQSGVWIGEFVSREGQDVTLKSARKIWRWRGANTTSEIALHGKLDASHSRVAEPVDCTVLGCCEVIESNPTALASVSACGWAP